MSVSTKLYLVQHAQAEPKDVDSNQPLSRKGRQSLEGVATFAAKQGRIGVALIAHSGKQRARETAEVLGKYLKPTRGVVKADDLSPMSDPMIWVDRLRSVQEDIMLVGHLPHLDRLSILLLTEDEGKCVIRFQNAGIVCIGRNDQGDWTVRWILTPDLVTSVE